MPRLLSWRVKGLELVVRTVDAVVLVGLPDLVGIAAGQLFGLFDDATVSVGVLNPATVDGDAADAAAPVAEVPVGSLTVAVALASIHFHVVTIAAQGLLKSSRARHIIALLQ